MLTLWLSESLLEVMLIKSYPNMNQGFCFISNLISASAALKNLVPANINNLESSITPWQEYTLANLGVLEQMTMERKLASTQKFMQLLR